MAKRPDLVKALERLDIPDDISEDDLARAGRDALVLQQRIAEHPAELLQLVGAVLHGNKAAAHDQLAALKMREADFQAEEGGFLWLVVLVVLLYATDAY